MLTKEELKHLAKLARIRLSEDELEKFQKDISRIVEFVGELQSLKTGEAGIAKTKELTNVFRADEESKLIEENGETLIVQAPGTQKGFVVVPEVFKDE